MLSWIHVLFKALKEGHPTHSDPSYRWNL